MDKNQLIDLAILMVLGAVVSIRAEKNLLRDPWFLTVAVIASLLPLTW